MRIGKCTNEPKIKEFFESWIEQCPWLVRLSQSQLLDNCPILSSEFTSGVLDCRSLHLDVHHLLTCTRQALKEQGGQVKTNFRVVSIESKHGSWTLTSDNGSAVKADIIVNAAGAWVDEVAQLAGVQPLGIQATRRTGIRCKPDVFSSSWPMCYLITDDLYFKPDGQSLMLSPCDETPTEPCDAQPERIDIARAIAHLELSTTLQGVFPQERWAGLRVFVPDQCPVVGYDSDHPGFFWYGAFGGFGVQTAPGCSKLGTRLLRHIPCTDTLLSELELSPRRLAPSV